MIRIIASLLLCLFTCSSLVAQTLKQFKTDHKEFYEQLHKFMTTSWGEAEETVLAEFRALIDLDEITLKEENNILKAANSALKKRLETLGIESDFQYLKETKRLSSDQLDGVIKTCNIMLKKRMRPTPHFRDYFYTIISFMMSNQPDSSFEAWQKSTEQVAGGTQRDYKKYIESCNKLFLANILHQTSSTTWQVSPTEEFYFEYDSLPKIIFPKLDLKAFLKKDSTVIYETQGYYLPTKFMFKGNGGKIYWDRAEISRDTSYAELSSYEISTRRPFFSADSVAFTHLGYFEGELQGKLKEKLSADIKSPDKARYPVFHSYSKKVILEEIEKDFDYEGGFTMVGSKFIGRGDSANFAKFIIKRDGQPFIKVASQEFTVKKDRIVSGLTQATIYLDQDSIFHPSLDFRYLKNKREVTLYRSGKGTSESPYYNTYHDVDMHIELLRWNMDNPTIEFTSLKGAQTSKVFMESSKYYSEERFDKFRGLASQNPLVLIKKYQDEMNDGYPEFWDSDFAMFIRLDFDMVKIMLVRLSKAGFITYNSRQGLVYVKDKLYHYIDAKSKNADYDLITFSSETKTETGELNGTLDLETNMIELDGVERIMVSDSQKVYIYPGGKHITLKENRDFEFGGVVTAGKFKLKGSKFRFDYDDFKVNLDSVESVEIIALTDKVDPETGKPKYEVVKSELNGMSGFLLLDDPNNKSGLRKAEFPQYPILSSESESYIYYDSPGIRGGVYTKDRMYFKLDPFKIDSLSGFSNQGLSFKGSFYSNGIFPEFEETLTLQEDHSLGFKRDAPEEGYSIYNGKGKFHDQVRLSNKGLMGDGSIKYLTSTSKSRNFVFYPDSVEATIYDFKLEERARGTEYPEAIGKNLDFSWLPQKDTLEVAKIEHAISMFHNEAVLHGNLDITPSSITGGGLIEFEEAEIESNKYNFRHIKFTADTANFRLKSEDVEKFAFATVNVHADIDLSQRRGEFISNDGTSYVEFPVNKYVCYMDHFKWYMDNKGIEVVGQEEDPNRKSGLDLSGTEFLSVHPGQDSLRFVAPSANYDLKNYIIEAHGVKFLDIADSRVYPLDGEIIIKPDAVMEELKGARILANRDTKYHTIFDANVFVLGKNNYKGNGKYEYTDMVGDKFSFDITEISVNDSLETIAQGEIEKEDNFSLSPYFDYHGSFKIVAPSPDLSFDGLFRIRQECFTDKHWIPFSGFIDPQNVMIPLDSVALDANKVKVYSGPILRMSDSVHVYPRFLGYNKFHADLKLSPAFGLIRFDPEWEEYQIGSQEKLTTENVPGNLVTLNTASCQLNSEGRFDFARKLGQVQFGTVGKSAFNTIEKTLDMDLMLTFDFFLDPTLWQHMITNLEGNPSLTPVALNRKTYELGLRELVGKEEASNLISQLNLYGAFRKFPDNLVHNLILSHVELKWDPEQYAFISKGQIGIGSIGTSQINKYVDGWVKYSKSRQGDRFQIYLEIDKETWYYFSYSKGIMQVLSGGEDFNATISELKPEKREVKGKNGELDYQFMQSTKKKKVAFVREMKAREEEEED